ncbi:HNH endonuclease [Chloroflexota bacterium]
MFNPGDIISYLEMCSEEGVNLQRGMNYRLRGDISVILMSLRPNAPYSDKVEEDGRILIYEGHDVPKTKENPIPKVVHQEMTNPSGTLNQNGLFYSAAKTCKKKQTTPELVKVYEKLHAGIWVYSGLFKLLDSWKEESNNRQVFKFKLELTERTEPTDKNEIKNSVLEHNRIIPPQVKLEVWKRDKGKCVICGSTDNLHFDHIIPFSKGGSSLVSQNIQLLCVRHNIAKRDRIE